MNDDTQEIGPRRRYFQYAVFALAALLVVSLGFVLIPREPAAPAKPPFTEQARASAFSDAVTLRAAGMSLAGAAATSGLEPQSAALNRVVTLLTVQAKALMLPADGAGQATVPKPSTPDLAAALQASGAARLKDAETADGGMARLLAGAGTAQLLAAEDLAAAAGIGLPALPGGARPQATETPNVAGAPGDSCVSASGSAPVNLGPALAAAAEAELELVYAYQAAMPRLAPASAGPASDFLRQHGNLRDDAKAMSRSHCAAAPPGQPGYALNQGFLAAPAAALGMLEAETLPVYGDVVALSAGSDRVWALSALQSAARRAAHWDTSPGPVPGMVLDESALPQLPEAAASTRPSTSTPSPGTP